LCGQESFDAVSTDFFKVLKKTHAVITSVAFIDMSESCAGIFGTLEAKDDFFIAQRLAVSFQVGALLVPGAASNAMRYCTPFSRYLVDESEITGANRAVHTAGGDKLLFYC